MHHILFGLHKKCKKPAWNKNGSPMVIYQYYWTILTWQAGRGLGVDVGLLATGDIHTTNLILKTIITRHEEVYRKCTANSQIAAAVVIVASPYCSADRNRYKASIPLYHATGVVAPPVIHQYCCPAVISQCNLYMENFTQMHNIKYQFCALTSSNGVI